MVTVNKPYFWGGSTLRGGRLTSRNFWDLAYKNRWFLLFLEEWSAAFLFLIEWKRSGTPNNQSNMDVWLRQPFPM